jgi:hypothetical protein
MIKTSEHKLKDGRELYRTHNGFRHFVVSKKGIATQVTEKYYNKCLTNNR